MVNIYYSYEVMGQGYKGYVKVQDMQGYNVLEENYYNDEAPYRAEISRLKEIYGDANWCEMKY